jgi:3-isopropylmalate/(R)-2-methylmalate dehydratase large subunit
MPPMTFAEKALARAAGLPAARAGDILQVRPDRILTHDNTAAIASIFHQELDAQHLADPEKVCIVLDHASPPPTPQHARNHAEARAFVRAQGVRHFFDVGRGICHQVLAEEGLVLPGDVILGADSHTTHAGWLGAFGAGVGRTEAAVLWATGEIWLRVPETIGIDLVGTLPPGVTAKDLCLQISQTLGADGGLYYSLEFGGPGLAGLSLDSRMVISNSMAEIGVKNAYLQPDNSVFDFLEQKGLCRQRMEARALYPDEGAAYIAKYEIRLNHLQPLVACPHDIDQTRPLADVVDQRVDLAFIGTCTNGRLEDLAAAARVLQGQRIHPATRLLVIPASSQVYAQALSQGILSTLVNAGAMIGVPGCGPCMGNHLGIPAAGEVVISTANRNFKGRMGQPEAGIYLASPAVVAASAVLGRIASPVEVDATIPFTSSGDSQPAMLRVIRLPQGDEVQPVIQSYQPTPANHSAASNPGQAGRVWKYGENINTDQIFPGKYTYTLTAPEQIAAHALEDLDPGFAGSVKPGDVLFAGDNFGCGSSREQAVTCLKYKGIQALVARSFARIFYRNAINQGIPAIVCPQAVAAAQVGDRVQIDLVNGLIHLGCGDFSFPPFPAHMRAILDAGGLVEYVKRKGLPE